MRRGADDFALLLMRLGFGLGMALAHGLPKVQGLMAGETGFVQGVARLGFPYPYAFAWASALIELVGGIAIALGLFTRPFAGLNAANMVVAGFWRHHAHHQLLGVTGFRTWTEEQLKAWGRPELALVYLLGFVALALMGAGALGLDGVLVGGRNKKPRRKYD
ncbi:MAG TPA: DoxX family protein [Vicinamibacteria bacterium]|nr:DoxX family protein [Vicinamibacteria bacterium]